MTGEYRAVPVEVLYRLPEINVSNYDHDEVCALNAWGVEVVLSAQPQPDAHPDDIAVYTLAERMRAKTVQKSAEGRGGWDDPEVCSQADLSRMLREHVEKGDPVDVANFCAFLSARGERILPAPQPEPPADLVERAKAAWRSWIARGCRVTEQEFIAAFAAEYAAEREKAAEEAYFAAAKRRQEYRERAEAAEQALEEKTTAYHGAVESRQHWRERAEVAERKTLPALVKSARAEEREACAKVADEHAAKSVFLSETAAEDTALLHGAEAMAAISIAAAIRARKGDTHE